MGTRNGDDLPVLSGVPRLPSGVLHRRRLLDRFDGIAALTVVCGPAGVGKTTLVADWLRGTGPVMPGLWVTVRESRTGRLALWEQVLRAMADAGWSDSVPGLGEALQALPTVEDPRELIVRTLARVRHDWLLVLDDEYLLDPATRRANLGLLLAIESLHVVVISREVGGAALTDAMLRVDTTVVGPDELRFTDDEIATLLDPWLGDLSDEQAEQLRASVGRLPLMVRTVAMALERRHGASRPGGPGHFGGPGAAAPRAGGQDATDIVEAALTRSVRDLLSVQAGVEQYRPFLLLTSIAPVVTPDLAGRLTGVADTGAMLDRAEHEGLGFWTPAGTDLPKEEAFRYSSAVRAVLREELVRTMPDRVVDLKRTVAGWAEEQGLFFTAFRCAMEIQDYDRASHLLRRAWQGIMLFNWPEAAVQIERVPLRTLYSYPLLAMMLALGYNKSGTHRLRAAELFDVAASGARMRAKDADPPERVMLWSVEGAALRVTGHLDRAARSASRAMGLFRDLTVEQRDELADVLPTLLNHNGITFLRMGQYRRALQTYATNFVVADGALRPQREYEALSLTAGTQAIIGDMVAARSTIARIEAGPWPREWDHEYPGAMLQVARMLLAIERLEFDEAQTHIDAMAPHLGTLEFWPTFAYGQALVDLATNRAAEGYERLTSLLEPGVRSAISAEDRHNLDATRALQLMALGRRQQAETVLASVPRHRPWAELDRAIAALAADRPERTLQCIDGALARMSGSDAAAYRERWRSSVSVVRAAAALRLGRDTEALAAVGGSAELLIQLGRRWPLVLVPHEDLMALRDLVDRRGTDAARQMLADAERVPSVFPRLEPAPHLTDRERVVLAHLVTTVGAAAIARELSVSPNTVKSQLRSLYKKFEASSREEALRAAAKFGLLPE